MATIGKLNFLVSASIANLGRTLEKGRKEIASFAAEADRQLSGVTSTFAKVAAAAATAATVGGLGFGIKLAADAEQAQVAFRVMLGSADAAKTVLADLQNFAATTPFEFPGIRTAAQSLVAFGVAQRDLIPSLRAVGDVAAGIGAPIEEIAELYGKAKVNGRLFADDINQLTGRGIPIIQELAKQFGVAESQVKALVESGQVNFEHLEAAFISLTSEGGKFHNLMGEQAKTLSGLWSNLKDTIGASLRKIGEAIVENFDLKGIIANTIALGTAIETKIVPAIAAAAGWLSEWGSTIVKSIVGIMAFVAALKAIVLVQQAIAKAQAIVLALSGPKGWAMLAAGAAVAAIAVYGVSKAFDSVQASAMEAKQASEAAAASAAKAGGAAGRPAQTARQQIEDLRKAFEAEVAAIHAETDALGKSNIELAMASAIKRGAIGFEARQIAEAMKAQEARRAEIEAAQAAVEATKAQAAANEDLIAQLREKRATIGFDAAQMAEWTLATNGATEEQIRQARELNATIKQIEDKAKAEEQLKSDVARIVEQTRTPLEQFQAELAHLRDLFNAEGGLDRETFDRASQQALEQMQQQVADNQLSAGSGFDTDLAAVEAGSAEAFSAINRHRGGGRNRIEALNEKQLAVQEAMAEHLRIVADAAGNEPAPADFD